MKRPRSEVFKIRCRESDKARWRRAAKARGHEDPSKWARKLLDADSADALDLPGKEGDRESA